MMEKRRVSSTSKARAPADTNATARRGSIGSALLTAAGQWHEAYWKQLPSCHPPVVSVPFHQHEVLNREWRADWDHHASLRLQLADQRRRYLARRGGHSEPVKGAPPPPARNTHRPCVPRHCYTPAAAAAWQRCPPPQARSRSCKPAAQDGRGPPLGNPNRCPPQGQHRPTRREQGRS